MCYVSASGFKINDNMEKFLFGKNLLNFRIYGDNPRGTFIWHELYPKLDITDGTIGASRNEFRGKNSVKISYSTTAFSMAS